MIFIDTLKFVNKLKAAGISEPVAIAFSDVQNEVFAEAMNNNIATKSDIDHLAREIDILANVTQRDLAALRQETKNDIAGLRQELKNDMQQLEASMDIRFVKLESKFKLLNWMFGGMMAGIGSVAVKTFFG